MVSKAIKLLRSEIEKVCSQTEDAREALALEEAAVIKSNERIVELSDKLVDLQAAITKLSGDGHIDEVQVKSAQRDTDGAENSGVA